MSNTNYFGSVIAQLVMNNADAAVTLKAVVVGGERGLPFPLIIALEVL